MLETMSQTPPSQNLAPSLQDEKSPTSPNNLKCGFVLIFLSLNAKGACGRAFSSSPPGRGQGISRRRENMEERLK